MSSATLNLRVMERRMMKKSFAAHYCGLPVNRFEASCPCRPVKIGNDVLYDKKCLDKWLDGLTQPTSKFYDREKVIELLGASN